MPGFKAALLAQSFPAPGRGIGRKETLSLSFVGIL
jgi:hypothetical protein